VWVDVCACVCICLSGCVGEWDVWGCVSVCVGVYVWECVWV
jgi:hypothetical protein